MAEKIWISPSVFPVFRMFKQSCDLEPLYDEIIRTAVFTVKPDNIATFLGQRITYNCAAVVGGLHDGEQLVKVVNAFFPGSFLF